MAGSTYVQCPGSNTLAGGRGRRAGALHGVCTWQPPLSFTVS